MGSALDELDLKFVYKTGEDNLYDDFYKPVLSCAIQYDRAVGYFSSGILSSNLKGLSQLLNHRGKVRLVIGNPLSPEEYGAICGEASNKHDDGVVVDNYISLLIEMIESQESGANRLQVLAYLVKTGYLEIKFALRPEGMYHEKIGIVYDRYNNCVVFQGSANETPSAMYKHINAECFSVYKSWDSYSFEHYGSEYISTFEDLWNNKRQGTTVLDVLSVHYERIAKYVEDNISNGQYNRMDFEEILKDFDDQVEEDINNAESKNPKIPKYLGNTKFDVRPHQREALKKWKENNFKGILKHATGSGKTITSIYALSKIFEEKNKKKEPLIVIISVPYIDLADQWVEELKVFNITPVRCYNTRVNWEDTLKRNIQMFKSNDLDFICILVVNKTLVSDHFQKLVREIPSNCLMVIGDECHRHGSSNISDKLPEAEFRLGLSATPFNDDDDEFESPFTNEAKNNILQYYQSVVHEYSLEDAINDTVLTPYSYHIVPVYLTEDEQNDYDILSEKIGIIVASSMGRKLLPQEQSSLMIASSARGRLLGSAENKLYALKVITKDLSSDQRKYSLFYVGEGKDSNEDQVIDKVTKVLRGNGWLTSQFIGSTPKLARKEILSTFKNGGIDALVAMKVLDEGIDVPACKTAYILASTKNPRQYVQRRGRVLRRSLNKNKADIYDFVILPNPNIQSSYSDKLISSELERIEEFTLLAMNKKEIENKIDRLGLRYEY